jgi:outer membrane receptor protein involved in Fe transport
MRKNPLHLARTLAALAALCGPVAEAGDSINDLANLSLEELAEYKVEAPTRTRLPLAESPGAVSVFTYDQIHSVSAQAIPDLMRLVPGMNVRWNPMVETMDLRGFGSNPFSSRILLLIDGVPYNSWDMGGFPQHPSFDFFNLENVKHLEVVRGGASSLYGENALNGVVNIVTLSGEELGGVKGTLYAGDLATRKLALIGGSRLGDDGSVLLSARASHSDMPMELWTEKSKGGVNGTDLFLKAKFAGWQFSAYQRKDDTHGYSEPQGAPFPPGTVFRSVARESQRVDILAAQYQHATSDDRWSFKLNLSHSARYGTSCSACHAATQSGTAWRVENDGYENIASAQVGIGAIPHHDITVGVEARRRATGDDPAELSETAGGAPAGAPIIDAYRKQAVYVQDFFHLQSLPLSGVLGARLDTDTTSSEFGSHVFPHAALIYTPRADLTLRGGWTQSARYPSFTEQYAAGWFIAAITPDTSIPLASFQPNHGLKPEFATETDLGIEFHPEPWWTAKLDAYQKCIRDFIVLTYPGGTFGNIGFQNHPNLAVARGIEAEWRADLPGGWSTFVNYALQRNSQSGGGVDQASRPIEFTYSPEHKINAGATWMLSAATRIEVDASWKSSYTAPAFWYGIAFPTDPTPRPLPAYTLLNAHFSHALTLPDGFGGPLTLVLDGRNLGNTRVYETLTGLGGHVVGRTLYAGVRYEFGR